MTMNLKRSWAQSESQSPMGDSDGTPVSRQSNSPRTPSGTRKKASTLAETKAKRTRTGCLTCRERHLKCDEALGRCLNCQKSDRVCRRGVRLNFIDIQTVAPPHVITRPNGTKVTFRDDSRFIASEYVGGFEKYPPVQPESPIQERRHLQQDAFHMMGPDQLASLFQSVAQSFDPSGLDSHSVATDLLFGTDAWHETHLVPGDELLPHGVSNFARKLTLKQYSPSCLTDMEQVLFLQAFVDAVGPWVDCMDAVKHFTEILPLHTIDEPMLLKAFAACGARYISHHDPAQALKANEYYEIATQDLLNSLQDPNRDSVLCAVVAIALAICETMLPGDASNKNHIAGSRALIRECRWNAKTPSLGGTCFWISVRIELLSCLQHNWSLSLDPDSWGVDLHMDNLQPHWKGDDIWLQRIIYICAKVLNFRYSMHSLHSHDTRNSDPRRNDTVQEWNHYHSLCEQWNDSSPRSMKPICEMEPWQVGTESQFPRVWIIKRNVMIARLFYHTTCFLLASIHPMADSFTDEMKIMRQEHTRHLCGSVVSWKDLSIAHIILPCLGTTATSLETRFAQEEVLHIIDSIGRDLPQLRSTIQNDLKRRWDWLQPETLDPTQIHSNSTLEDQPRTSNPLWNTTNLSLDHHPYQEFYVPPHHNVIDDYHHEAYLI